jgi:hypothetical protein
MHSLLIDFKLGVVIVGVSLVIAGWFVEMEFNIFMPVT